MKPATCDLCRLFVRDPVNPPAGMGECRHGHGAHYPMAPHWCRHWEARPA